MLITSQKKGQALKEKKGEALKILTEKLQLWEILMMQTHMNKKIAQLKFLSRARFYSARSGGKNQCHSKSDKKSTNQWESSCFSKKGMQGKNYCENRCMLENIHCYVILTAKND